jgi:hypothetical protein
MSLEQKETKQTKFRFGIGILCCLFFCGQCVQGAALMQNCLSVKSAVNSFGCGFAALGNPWFISFGCGWPRSVLCVLCG